MVRDCADCMSNIATIQIHVRRLADAVNSYSESSQAIRLAASEAGFRARDIARPAGPFSTTSEGRST